MSIFYLLYREIIGYIDGIEAPRSVGNNQQYKFFKFFMNNGNGKRIQIVAWNENIDIVEKYIQANYVSVILPFFNKYYNGKLYKKL